MRDIFKTSLEFVPSDFGYIEPGHGMKGKQKWLHDNADIEEMYTHFLKKRDVLLWCYSSSQATSKVTGKKRSSETLPVDCKTKSACLSKIKDVEKIVQDLKEKHKKDFSIEQLNTWAHLIHIGKHTSHETPPDLPFFRGIHRNKASSSSSVATSLATDASMAVSPGKRVSLRSECINQLDKWHSLLEKGVISQEQYDGVQKTIMSDVMKF